MLLAASAHTLLSQAVNGIFAGSIYALFAAGYTLVFGVLDILNLAHSAVFMLGAVLAYTLAVTLGWPFYGAVAAATLACGAIGFGIDRVGLRPLRRRHAPQLGALLTTLGLALAATNIVEVRFGANARSFPASVPLSGNITVGGLVLSESKLATLLLSLVLAAALGALVRRTRAGRAMRAVAENPRAALLMGIDVDSVIAWTMVISSALGALAGILYGLSQHDINPFMGRDQIELKGLAVIVLGGMGSVRGAVVAGYLLGLAEVAALVVFGSSVSFGVAFLVLFIALVAFPGGLFGAQARRV